MLLFLESGTRPLSRPRAGCRRWWRAPWRWWSLWWRARGWGPGARTDGAGPQTDWDRQRAGRETSMITWDVMTSQETLKHNLWWNSATLKWAPKGNKSSIHYIEIILSRITPMSGIMHLNWVSHHLLSFCRHGSFDDCATSDLNCQLLSSSRNLK